MLKLFFIHGRPKEVTVVNRNLIFTRNLSEASNRHFDHQSLDLRQIGKFFATDYHRPSNCQGQSRSSPSTRRFSTLAEARNIEPGWLGACSFHSKMSVTLSRCSK